MFLQGARLPVFILTFLCLPYTISFPKPQGEEFSPVRVPKSLKKRLRSFEPSAVVRLPGEGRYLVASDDTDENDAAMLFEMNSSGEVSEDPLPIRGLEAMTDIESISWHGDELLVLSSLSRNRKGKELPERNLLVRARPGRQGFSAVESVDLRSRLLEAMERSPDPLIRSVQERLDELLETEASAVVEGRLIVGLKDPQPEDGVALLLDLGAIDDLFGKGSRTGVRVFGTVDFKDPEHKLSDISVTESGWFLTSTREGGGGGLWSFKPGRDPVLLKAFEKSKPEGLTPSGLGEGELLLVSDGGSKKGGYLLQSTPQE